MTQWQYTNHEHKTHPQNSSKNHRVKHSAAGREDVDVGHLCLRCDESNKTKQDCHILSQKV